MKFFHAILCLQLAQKGKGKAERSSEEITENRVSTASAAEAGGIGTVKLRYISAGAGAEQYRETRTLHGVGHLLFSLLAYGE